MSEDRLQVELVAADRLVWSGEADMVIARTALGDIGILRNHAPVLSVMDPCAVEIRTGEETVVAAVDGGFVSMAANRVSILAERADLASDLDLSEARRELEEATAASEDDEDAALARRHAEAKVQAAERAS
jgi:F-type H+-transporting ATPase subunit epsilon